MDSPFDIARCLIGRTCLALDDEDYQSFLDDCSPQFTYRITAHSPEIGQEMVWLEHSREGYESLIKMLPKHTRLQGRFCRQAALAALRETEPGRFRAVSHLTVVYTTPEGESRLLLAGRYIDEIVVAKEREPKLESREVRLDTRLLGPGIHTPI